MVLEPVIMRFVAVEFYDVWLHPGFYFKDEHDEQKSEQPPDGERDMVL